jgi:hypothetical protein
MDEEYRVEVELDDPEHGYSVRERLRALDLDDKARDRLGRGVVVTRDGARLFLYTTTESQGHEAERVVRELVAAEGLTADTRLARWHEVEEAWKDASVPLPESADDVAAERQAHEAAELAEAATEGEYDWTVVVHLPARRAALDLARRVAAEGYPVTHRWRYVIIGVVTEEAANELASELRASLIDKADVRVEVDLSDVARSPLQFLPF